MILLNFKNSTRLIYSKFHEKALSLINIYITVTKYPTKFKVINHISPSDQFGAFPCIFLQYQKFVKTSSKSKLKQMISIYGYMNNNSNSYLTHNFNITIGEQYQQLNKSNTNKKNLVDVSAYTKKRKTYSIKTQHFEWVEHPCIIPML